MSKMSRLAICVATMSASTGNHVGDIPTWRTHAKELLPVYTQHNTPEDNLGVIGSYQKLYEQTDEDLLMFLHDDVICREEGWDERVIKEFTQSDVGVVGFGGALEHGTGELYKTPYKLQQLRRSGYLSNVDDAEVHGQRFTGAHDVAVLDGFCLIVRRTVLDRLGGWNQVSPSADFFCYDYALSCLVRRLNYRIRVVGVRCHHRGGQTSVKGEKEGNGGRKVREVTSMEAYEKSHRWFYESFRDVMPYKVEV